MLSGPDIRRVAAVSSVDERTIERFLKGEPVRPSSRSRIRSAMGALGFAERVTAIDNGPAKGAVRMYGHSSFYPDLDVRGRAERVNADVTRLATRQAAEVEDDPRAYAKELIVMLTNLSEQAGLPFEMVARVVLGAMKRAEKNRASK